ncbi:unnamed protein product [Linum trigynum]|uniref:RPN1 N-terminal domain-containing protein n=1 Tax=Linum trigynum TaxID=586398 RepID=A0AAV2FSI2_9ROSI
MSSGARGSDRTTELSAEDYELKQKVDKYVKWIIDGFTRLRQVAIRELSIIQDSANSLRFVQPHFESLIKCYLDMPESYQKNWLIDILSALALNNVVEGGRESLKNSLLGPEGEICSLGHYDIWKLAGQIVQEYAKRQSNLETDDSKKLVQQIVAFYMKVKENHLLIEHFDGDSTCVVSTCSYLMTVVRHLAQPDAMIGYDIVIKLLLTFEEYHHAFLYAVLLDNLEYMKQVLTSCDDSIRKEEFCYILGLQNITLTLDEDMFDVQEERRAMQSIINNSNLSKKFLGLANFRGVEDPISPENICKSNLLDLRNSAKRPLPRKNLARIFLETFVNASSGRDQFRKSVEKFTRGPLSFILNENDYRWLTSTKRIQFKASAVAGLGLIMLWDVDSYLDLTSEYLLSNDSNILAGALLGVGIVNSRVKKDRALPLLNQHYDSEDPLIRIASTMGWGIAYAGTQNEQICNKLIPVLDNVGERLDVAAFAAISLGLVFVGSCNKVVAEAIISALKNRNEFEKPIFKFLPLSLGLIFLGAEGRVEDVEADVSEIDDVQIREYCSLTLLSCAYAGTRDSFKIPELVKNFFPCLEKGGKHPELAVLGISMIQMVQLKTGDFLEVFLKHILPSQGVVKIRRSVPLAIGLICLSDPKDYAIEKLTSLSYDADEVVASASIISLGLVGARSCNARIADRLNELALYYYKSSVPLFCVRLAQGLLHLGKGLLTLTTYPYHELFLSRVGLGGMVIFLHACLNLLVTSRRYHFVIYFLVLAIQLRGTE